MTLASPDGPYVHFANESMIFRPFGTDLAPGIEGVDFARIYNRLPCQDAAPLHAEENDALARGGFQEAGRAWVAPSPVTLTSITVELPDAPELYRPCFAYRTTDGVWHGHFEGVSTVYDAAAALRRATFQVNAEHVDSIGVVVYTAAVSAVSIVSRPE